MIDVNFLHGVGTTGSILLSLFGAFRNNWISLEVTGRTILENYETLLEEKSVATEDIFGGDLFVWWYIREDFHAIHPETGYRMGSDVLSYEKLIFGKEAYDIDWDHLLLTTGLSMGQRVLSWIQVDHHGDIVKSEVIYCKTSAYVSLPVYYINPHAEQGSFQGLRTCN